MPLQFDSVAFSYGSTAVLKGLNLQVSPGEIVGFLGLNGSGKTTTFLLATGVLAPAAGSISVFGHDPRRSRAWCSQVGVVHSNAGHYNRLSVRRNVEFFANLHGVQLDLDRHLERHGLRQLAGRPAGQLSQGYRQRLSLARATVHEPQLLLLDEPSDGLDPGASEELQQLVTEFAQQGKGVLMSSHRIEEVEAWCHRIVLLADGVALMDGTPEALGSGAGGGLRAKMKALRAERAGETRAES